ncbi:MAG: glycosyltransferase family 2 protein [Elusimicrobia bacterium]|nr:glycosyltransferase family 2 protein [Elusimicrobiota bacterium]
MTEAPFFSINIPTRNRAGMLRAALKSLLWQTCGDFECRVMDDGSTDATPEVFKEFSGDARFIWERFSEHKGVTFGRNHAAQQARGRFITFLDDDDIWLPERLARFKAEALAKPEVGFWFSNAYVWRYDRIIGRLFTPGRPIPEGVVPGYYAIGDRYLPYVSSHMAIARAAFEKVGYFRPELDIMVDTELAVRVMAGGFPVGAIHEPMAIRRLHDAQVTRDHQKALRECMRVLETAAAPPEVDRAYRRELTLDAAVYTLKNLEPAVARRLLADSSIPRDLKYRALTLASYLPVPALAALRRLRTAVLLGAPQEPERKAEFKAVEDAVRKIL